MNRKNINANALISLAGELTVAICRQMSPLIIVLAGIALMASTFAIAFRDTSLLPVLIFSLKASFFAHSFLFGLTKWVISLHLQYFSLGTLQR
ncbi:hypothetical protein D9543_02935 [Corynebacterium macginleyi]|uniref:Uncharacterized protein n=1 Tax=Corynebacterium macginleyi TaxID=38290 RepID=A0A3M0GF95_9CORY|nr:hypothetical protein D9543_02935 [Corynebacterium macginleyi]